MGRVVKSLGNTTTFMRLGWKRAGKLIDKHGPSAQMGRVLSSVCTAPAPSAEPTILAYALVGALGTACIVGSAGFAGVIPAHGLAMTLAGTTAFTLLNDHWRALHDQVPTAMLILGFLAPLTLFSVNSRELFRVTRLPPEAGRVLTWLLSLAYDGIVGLSRFLTTMKPIKPLKRIRGLLMRLRFRRQPAPAV